MNIFPVELPAKRLGKYKSGLVHDRHSIPAFQLPDHIPESLVINHQYTVLPHHFPRGIHLVHLDSATLRVKRELLIRLDNNKTTANTDAHASFHQRRAHLIPVPVGVHLKTGSQHFRGQLP